MILAAAIRCRIKETGKEVVLCGARHGDIFNQMDTLGLHFDDESQGFINHNNTFLTREEAFEHAKSCGQLCQKIIHDRENGGIGGKKLISEDLW